MSSPVKRSLPRTIGSLVAAVGLLAMLAGKPSLAQLSPPTSPRMPVAPVRNDARHERPVAKGYAVPAERLQAVTAELQEHFASRPAIYVVADDRTSQVVVVAPAVAHQEVPGLLDAATESPPFAPARPAGTKEVVPAAAIEPISVGRAAHVLKNISTRDAEQALAAIWGKTASFGVSGGGETTTIQIAAPNHSEALLVVDHRRDLVTVDAPQETIDSWRRVVEAIDSPRRPGDAQIDVVPFAKADPVKIRRAVQLVASATKNSAALMPLRGMHAAPGGRRQHIGQYVSMIFQAEGQPAGGQPAAGGQPQPGGPPEIAVQPGGQVGGGAAEAIGRIGNVQIEFVPGLDILIIRGNKRDVELVKKIIQQIEELSIQTQPEVEIYYLQNVGGQQMADMVNQIYTQVFASQSLVTLVPLGKPNAILLIGRKEAIVPVIDLIRRLDQPVIPDTQLKVFPLKFLPAVDAERMVRTFFTPRPGQEFTPRTGLGTRILAIADFRSNSLIVQASPRDLDELARLLEQIDVEGWKDDQQRATNEVKVFKLRNSLADDLVLVIQEAITGQVQGQQQQQQQQQVQQPGGGQGAGTPTPQSSARRETRLQIMSLDQRGKQIIESGILSDLRVSADPRSNSLVVVGPASTMPLMEELIRQLDGPPGADAQVKVFTIVNGDATQLATMLQTVFGTQTTQAGGAGGFQSATGSAESALVPLRFAVDTRTNSIIATGAAGDLRVVYNILVRLDEADIRQRELKVYRLKNTSATAVATALTNFLTQQTQLQQAQGQLISALEALEERVIVVDDPVTNSLIVSATTRYLPHVEKLIEDLDRRNPMVVIQLVIAEVTLSDLDEFGAQFGLQDSLLFQRSIIDTVTGAGTPGFNFNNQPLGNRVTGAGVPGTAVNTQNTAGQGLTDFALGRTNALGFGGLVLSASSESVSVLIRALQQSSRIQILSRPQVQTMDNQPAYVQVGSDIPRVTSSTPSSVGGFSNSFSDIPVGIILGVTPRVTPDGMVVMEIDAEKSEVGTTSDPGALTVSVDAQGNPVTQVAPIRRTKAQTTITARSGQTVILGGLITTNNVESTRRVPYLGDVPVLGRLFRFDSMTAERREIMFILTPYIMDTKEAESLLNLRETERMSWCLADLVNIHGALPEGTAAGDVRHPASPLIFPDETPAGQPMMQPGTQNGTTPMPPRPMNPTPMSPMSRTGVSPTPADSDKTKSSPALPPQSSRRASPSAPDPSTSMHPPRWRPQAAQPEVVPAIQFEERYPAQSIQDGSQPAPAGLTPATIAPASFQRSVEPDSLEQQKSIYEP